MVYNTDMKARKPHAKRFERDTTQTPRMRLTSRDVAILRHVSRHRFLNAHQIMTLVGNSPRIVRRLQALFQCGYLDRPRAQLVYYANAGSEPLVYALARKGAQVLAETDHERAESFRWTLKNKRAGQTFVQHTIEAADILVRLATSDHGGRGIRLVAEDQVLREAPAATRDLAHPYKLSAEVEWAGKRHKLAVVPDGVFALEFGDDILAPIERANFFLELDRETMPVMRKARSLDKHNRQTSILSKLLTYHRVWRAKLHTERYGWESFRVLTVTTSEQRIKTMLEAVNDITEGRGSALFLFATAEALKQTDIVSASWLNGKGERTTLAD